MYRYKVLFWGLTRCECTLLRKMWVSLSQSAHRSSQRLCRDQHTFMKENIIRVAVRRYNLFRDEEEARADCSTRASDPTNSRDV